jgi:hypothetical protein
LIRPEGNQIYRPIFTLESKKPTTICWGWSMMHRIGYWGQEIIENGHRRRMTPILNINYIPIAGMTMLSIETNLLVTGFNLPG